MNAVVPLAEIANICAAQLPAVYEGAKRALAECDRIDECKSWADKAAALRSYAAQAKDDSLRVLAVRIQARAERRAGELLRQIPSGSTSNLVQHRQEGDLPSVTRTRAATEAGLSEHRRKQAIRIATVPEESFHHQVESASPPSISRLAAQGTASPRAGGARPPLSREANVARHELLRFALFCEGHDPGVIARGIPPEDIEGIRECVATIDRWLDSLVASYLE